MIRVPSYPRCPRLPRCGGAVVLALCVVALTARADPPPDDPFPLQRVLLPADRLTGELVRVRDGVLVRLPRDEFEALVRQAAGRGRPAPPRLAEARYRAALVEDGGGAFLSGTAEWKVLHRGDGAGLLRLAGDAASFNLAVRQPRYANRDAVLAAFPERAGDDAPRSLALLVDQPGEHAVTLDWSARTEPRPDGLHVDLRVPPAPAASFEVELPADRSLLATDGSLVSGPLRTETDRRRLWRVACGGKTQVALLIRRPAAGSPVVQCWQKTVQRLVPEGLEASTTLTLEALHQELTAVVLDCDPQLRPLEVLSPALERFEVTPGKDGGRTVLTVQMARPVREATIEIRCLAPLAAAGSADRTAGQPRTVAWASPGLRTVAAQAAGAAGEATVVPRGETLELWVHPDLTLVGWQPGDFRLTDSSLAVDGETRLTMRRLTLIGGGLASEGVGRGEAQPRRPAGQLQAGGVEVRARQQSWWRLGGDGMELWTQVGYEVTQGQLFRLALHLPAGWDAEMAEVTPADLMRSWGVRTGPTGSRLVVDLRRPVQPTGKDTAVTLTARLRRPGRWLNQEVPFPDVVPLGARFREGGLGIAFDEHLFRTTVRTALPAGDPPAGGLWGTLLPDLYYPLKVDGAVGTVRLQPRPARFRARVLGEVQIAGGRGLLASRLVLEGETGAISHVDVVRAGDDARPGEWRVESEGTPAGNRVRRVDRQLPTEVAAALAPLAARGPLAAATLAVTRPAGTRWRIQLDRHLPLRQSLTVRTTSALVAKPDAAGDGWELPLLGVIGPGRGEGEVTVRLDGAKLTAAEAVGVQEGRGRGNAVGELPGRVFVYTDRFPRLRLHTRAAPNGQAAQTLLDRGRLTTVLGPAGELRHHFRFRARRWPQSHLPVTLPSSARLLAVAVAGQPLAHVGQPPEEQPLAVPVPGGPEPVWVEILYTTPAVVGPLWATLESAGPELPVRPETLERRWLLPPAFTPLGDRRWRPLPGGGEGPATPAGRLAALFRLGPSLPLPGNRATEWDAARRAITDAVADLRADHGGRKVPLAAAVEDLAAGYLNDQHPLVIDAVALRRSGYFGNSPLAVSTTAADDDLPWADGNLVLLPGRTAVLLTTRTAPGAGAAGTVPEELEEAVTQAGRTGQDPAGRFLTAVEWLRLMPARDDQAGGSTGLALTPGAALEGWTTWAPVAAPSGVDGVRLTAVRRSAVAAGGVALAVLAAAIQVAARRRTVRRRLLLTLGWLAAAGLAAAWLPAAVNGLGWWPLLGGLCWAVGWYLAWASRRLRGAGARSTMKRPRSTGAAKGPSSRVSGSERSGLLGPPAATGLLLALALLAGQRPADGDTADPEPVYLVPEQPPLPAGVLVRPAALGRLRDLARATQPPVQGAVLAAAGYDGRLVPAGGGAARAEFIATFEAHVFGDGPATLLLPLDGVQLTGDVLLDGARVLPTAVAGPPGGYALRVRGSGRHRINLRFQVAVEEAPTAEAASGIRQVRFQPPSLAQSRLTFEAPTAAGALQVATRYGGRRVTAGNGVQRLEADLGAVPGPVLVRWLEEARPPRVAYREAYLWDLRPDASLLTALVRYDIDPGAVSTLLLDLPPELEVRAAQARRPAVDGDGPRRPASGDRGGTLPVRLSNWTTTGTNPRTLRLEFPWPVVGPVEVVVELMPRGPWTAASLLPLPRPHGQPAAGEAGYLAYRAHALSAVPANWLRLTGIERTAFAPFWPAGSRPAAETITYASRFIRDPRLPPELRLQMRPLGTRLAGTQRVEVVVTPTQAEFRLAADLTAEGNDLSVLEWDVQAARPLVVTAVNGAGVSRWSQVDGRLLVWLDKTAAAARLQVVGWTPLAALKSPATAARLELPRLRLAGPATVSTRVSVTPAIGATLTEEAVHDLAPDPTSTPRQRVYVARGPAYGGTFLVRPGPPPTVDVTTTARLDGKDLVFHSVIDYRIPGEVRSVHLRVRDWEGDVTLEAPPKTVARRREQQRRSAGVPPRGSEREPAVPHEWEGSPPQWIREHAWTLELVPGVADRYQLELKGRLPVEDAAGGMRLPAVLVTGAQTTERLVLDPSLAVESALGVAEEPPPDGVAAGTRAWHTRSDYWDLRVVPREPAGPARLQMLLTEVRSVVPDAGGWLHQARLWVDQEGATELRAFWRADVEVTAATVDGAAVPVADRVTRYLVLSGSGRPGVRCVTLRYRHRGGSETLYNPDLYYPHIDGARGAPVVWTVDVPPGWELGGSAGGVRLGVGATARATVELHRATVALARLRGLAAAARTFRPADLPANGSVEAALTQTQQQLTRSCWLAELALSAGADAQQPLGPGGETLPAWLASLRRQNRAVCEEHDLTELIEEASKGRLQPPADPEEPAGPGVAYRWQVDYSPTAPPRDRGNLTLQVALTPTAARQTQAAVVFSGQWLFLLVGVWALTLTAAVRGVLRVLWPEEVALLGLVGWQLAGPTVVVLALIGIAAAARGLLVRQTLRRYLRHRPPRDPAATGSRAT